MGEGLRKALSMISRSTIIDAKTIREFNKELQKVLIASDVEVDIVFKFTKEIEKKALASKPPAGLPPKEYITNIVYEGLVELMGNTYSPEIKPQRILLLGLYGSGKTTTAAKLARFYQNRGMSTGLICCDVSRPAAYEQLETLAKSANASFFGVKGEKDAAKIAEQGLKAMKGKQVIICDTSGRSALDDVLITELKAVNKVFAPDQKILVLSADIGQVAGVQSREFDKAVKINGVIVSKMDGSGKGGGALSAAASSGAKVLFIGEGEKVNDLQPYDPNSFIGGLLGIPNIAALVGKVQSAVKEAGVQPEDVDIDKMDFETFYTQLKAINKMGPLKNIFGMIGAADVPKEMIDEGEEKLKKYKYIISSMTREERKDASLLHNQSRISRVARGSGTSEKDVRDLISNFNKMKKSYKSMKNNRNLKKMFGG